MADDLNLCFSGFNLLAGGSLVMSVILLDIKCGGCDLENQLLGALCGRNPLLYPTQQKKHNENIQLCSSRLFLATEAL